MSDFFKNLTETLIIAEIGQNHQGDLHIAKKLIKTAKECGANCVKFQKTHLKSKFAKTALNRPYDCANSFGKTYGEHKAFLEFTEEEFKELQRYSKEQNILFTASAMDEVSLDFLIELQVPFIKIGSGDANNFKLIERAAKSLIPLVISTGMQEFGTVKKIYEIVSKYHQNFALLHCVSAYPVPYDQVNLNVINLYMKEFPNITIGYSGHEIGSEVSIAAVALGSKILERHLTLDKTWKGTDHSCSLDSKEFRNLVSGVRRVEQAFGVAIKKRQKCEKSCYEKLGKSLVYADDFKSGHKLKYEDLNCKVVEPKGTDGAELFSVLNKILSKDVKHDDGVLKEHFFE